MSERADNVRFFIHSQKYGKELIGEIEGFDEISGESYSLQEEGYFSVERGDTVTLFEQGYNRLLSLLLEFGPSVRVRLIKEVKDELSLDQNWLTEFDDHINMYTLSFEEDTDNLTVVCELISGGDLKMFEESFDDEYDIVGPAAPGLPYVNLKVNPRAILKRSRFIESNVEVDCKDDLGATARAVPLELDYTAEKQYIGEVSNTFANSVGGDYAQLQSSGNLFLQNAPNDKVYKLNGTVEIQITQAAFSGSLFKMDLVRYVNGPDRNYDQVLIAMGSATPTQTGAIISYTFVDYEINVLAGHSLGIMTLSDTGSVGAQTVLKYKLTENTDFRLQTDTPFPTTYTKALKPLDAFKAMAGLISDDPAYPVVSSVFGPGGRHEDKLLVHGTWLRNMPPIINEGEDDERRLQANLSMEDLYEAYSILEPLRYDVIQHNGKTTFTVGAFKDIQQNFTAIRIGEVLGVDGPVELVEVSDKGRDVLGDNYYRTIKIGSETSGSNYGETNNIFSVCGYAEWKTIHRDSEGEYEVVTDFRTGAEDVELQRQFQWKDNPDIDGEYDNDWFLIDAKWNGVEYEPKDWTDYYEVIPSGVYSPETNYNWCFVPVELLRGHGYKVNAALQEDKFGSLLNPTGNCNLSLKIKRTGEQEVISNEPFPHSLLEKPRIRLLMVNFSTPLNQEISEQLRGNTKGVDNKHGLMEILYNGQQLKGRLFQVRSGEIAQFQMIQAVL